ncbi:DUF2637 domain-containing protein [Streptomyces brevispora]|uniref:DUF2637 domain-containing protein n=1 Tax=Streptomyces brevispora TaxID=887462 RepID=UPI002E328959|nr:DUF2637 domain-containing protein [Streptomyces brevispora]
MQSRPALTRLQRRLVAVVASGAALIAGIGFAGSYAAVRDLARHKGFGNFALAFPIGLDAGIVVLLALDLLLSWLRMPYAPLRHTAWLLTASTIAFNGAAAWPDPLGVGMHAVIPVLFVVVVEAARAAVGRLAAITADRHIESVRLSRWLLSPLPTFRLWRRMKLWELRSYDDVIRLEQDRLVYRARLQARYGRTWRWNAPVELRLQLRLARYGQPLPALDPQPVAAEPVQPDAADDAFDRATEDALALAPPTTALALPAAPATTAAQPDAQPAALPEPTNTVPPGARLLPVVCRPQPAPALGSTGLHLDLVQLPNLHPDVTTDAQPQPLARMRTHSAARPDDDALIDRAAALTHTGPLTLRRLQGELGIGQRRAQRILPAAVARSRVAAAVQPQPTALGVHS